jgi:hypothetical protein
LRSWRKANRFKIEDPALALQVNISKMLGFAFVLSITGIFGVGSLIALVIGVKAWRIIKESNGRLNGLVVHGCPGLGFFDFDPSDDLCHS